MDIIKDSEGFWLEIILWLRLYRKLQGCGGGRESAREFRCIVLLKMHPVGYTHIIHIVPAVICNAPVSSNGVITVTWSYIHTGGLPLTNLYLTYTQSIPGNGLNAVSIISVDTTSIVFPNLVTGTEYIFNVTAENSYGSSSITCGSTPHIIGKLNVKQNINM